MKGMSNMMSRRKPKNSKAIWKFINVGVVPLLPIILILGIALSSLSSSPVLAQGVEAEPNNPCTSAQDFGAVTFPFTVDGSLDTPPDTPDVDFFMFTGTPNDMIAVDLEGQDTGAGTLSDPFLGFFDSDCNFIALNDDGGLDLNSRLVITIPSDGIFILAATSCCDSGFTGKGGSSGSYQMTISPFAAAGSIAGRVVNRRTGNPLRGDAPPFALVELRRCFDEECSDSDFVNEQFTNSRGRFEFSSDFDGAPLAVGRYQIVAFANQFQEGQTMPFNIGEGEDRNVGNIRLRPNPIQFVDVKPCEDLPTEGGVCEYRVRIRNTTTGEFKGAVWSLVGGDGIGSFLGFTEFQTGRFGQGSPAPQNFSLDPGASRELRFQIRVPGTVADGAVFFIDALAGRRPNPVFNTVGVSFLFDFTKGPDGFTIVHENKARRMFQRMRGAGTVKTIPSYIK